ncbi:MAG: hypothetical protein JSV56_10790 [Methanomassiliicoccales archaeon]|nr:MAG: hypothetical protein JSV56_10790 [Methanomassiliicoccales archaeon]
MNELYDNNMDLNDVLEVIESGYDCPKSKRSKEKIERCLDQKRKTIRVVIAKSYSDFFASEVWIVIHVGVKSKPKVRK